MTALRVNLLHKQRGQGKAWNSLDEGDRIRVDSRGKAILIQVSPLEQHANEIIAWDTLEISLYDTNNTIFYTQDQKQPDGHPVWQFHSKKGVPASSLDTQYRLVKVYLHPAHLCFRATVRTAKGERLSGTSITVQASISGTVRNGSMVKKRPQTTASTSSSTVVELQQPKKRDSPPSDPASSPPPPSTAIDFTVTSNLRVEGHIRAEGFFGLSDERLKNDIELLSEASNKLSQLEGCSFRWIKNQPINDVVVVDSRAASGGATSNISTDMKKIYGFIAQRVAQILPEAVQTTNDGFLAVEYSSVVPVFVEALKEHVEKLKALQADLKEIQQLQDALKQLGQNLSSLASHAPNPPRSSSTLKNSSSRKRRPSGMASYCPPTKKSQFVAIFGAVGLALLIIAVGLGFGLSANQVRPPTAPQAPVSFSGRNFLFDGSFEDPVSSWWGSGKIMSYNDTNAIPAASVMWETAPFNPGRRFAFFNTSQGLSDLNQDVPSLFDGNITVQVIAWVFLPREIDPQNAIWASLVVSRSGSVVCEAKIAADPTKMYRWQVINFESTCWMTRNDTLRVTFQATGPDMIAAVDWVELRYPLSMISTRSNMSYLNNGERNGEIIHELAASAFLPRRFSQEASIVVAAPDGGFVIGVVEMSTIDTNLNIAIVKVDAGGRLDQNFGSGGVVTIPRLLQADFSVHGEWIAIDRRGRIMVCGRTRLRDSFYAPAIVRLTPLGSWDVSFGGGVGIVPLIVSGDDSALSIFPRPNDQYLVVSLVQNPSNIGSRRVAIHRLQHDGRNDESFAFWHGNVLAATTSNRTFASVDNRDENVILSWTAPDDHRVYNLRVGSWGLINSTYGSSGMSAVSLALPGNVVQISKTLLLSNGGLLIVGSSSNTPIWTRLHPNGIVDSSWNASVVLDSFLFPASNATSRSASSMPDGSLIVSITNDTHNFFIRLFSNGSRDASFCDSGVLSSNVSSVGRLGRFAANNQSVLLAASIPIDSSPADASFVSLAIQESPAPTPDRILFQDSAFPVPPRFVTLSIVVDPNNSSHIVYLAGHTEASLFVAAFDVSSDQEAPVFGVVVQNMSSILLAADQQSSNSSARLGAVLTVPDGFLLIYTQENTIDAQSQVVLEKISFLGDRQPQWAINGSILTRPDLGAQNPRGAMIPSENLIFISSSTQDDNLWIGSVNISSGINVTNFDQTFSSPDSFYSSVLGVEHVLATNTTVFVIGNLFSTPGTTAGALWISQPDASSVSFIIIKPPAGYSSSYLMSGLIISENPDLIYVGGFLVNGSTQAMMIARVNVTSSSLDSSFGINGIIIPRTQKDSFGYIRKMFWDDSSRRIVAFGASAEAYSSLRVASFSFDPNQQTFDCVLNATVGMHRYHQASLGVRDVVHMNDKYIVAIETPQNLKYVRFMDAELATCRVYCGDGLIEADEWCDDGNDWSGDGCSSWCTTEPGWLCRFPGTPCN